MDMQMIFFPQGNDVVVEARYGPEITTGTGMSAKLFVKDNRYTPDSDQSTTVYTSGVSADPANAAQFMSSFTVPDTDTAVTGAFWYRVELFDALGNHRTTACGTLLVEAV